MNWGQPYWLLLLLLLPVGIYLLIQEQSRLSKRLSSFAEEKFHSFYLQGLSRFQRKLKLALLLVAYTFMVIALARPQWDSELQMVNRTGIDIVVCIDVSKSMDATDIQPSRLLRAKDQISLFIDQLKGDRVAIVPFAGAAFVQCPLTDDYGALKMFVNSLSTDTVPVLGTDIGKALEKASKAFLPQSNQKLILLLSDGEDLEQGAVKLAEKLGHQGIRIYALGIGSPEGSTVPIVTPDGNATYARDENGEYVISKLDTKTLSQIAKATSGQFYLVTPQQNEIFKILARIQGMEKARYTSSQFQQLKEQYTVFVLPLILLLIIELVIRQTRKPRRERFLSQGEEKK